MDERFEPAFALGGEQRMGQVIRSTRRPTPKPLTRDAASKMFHRREVVSGVDPVEGRGWYGVCRIAADLVEDVAQDERVQNAVTANSRGVRRSHHQEKGRATILAQASETREKMRAGSVQPRDREVAPDAVPAALRAAGITLSVAQVAALAAVVGKASMASTAIGEA